MFRFIIMLLWIETYKDASRNQPHVSVVHDGFAQFPLTRGTGSRCRILLIQRKELENGESLHVVFYIHGRFVYGYLIEMN